MTRLESTKRGIDGLLLWLLVVSAVAGGVVQLAGCPGAGGSPEVCMAPKLAAIESAYIAEAVEKCGGGKGWQACEHREAIEQKYDAQRAAAEKECQ